MESVNQSVEPVNIVGQIIPEQPAIHASGQVPVQASHSGWFFSIPLKNDGVRQWEGLYIPYMKWKIIQSCLKPPTCIEYTLKYLSSREMARVGPVTRCFHHRLDDR